MIIEIKKAVVPVAGFGTRFLPATKSQPKEMLPIVDTPIIQYVVNDIVNSGIEDIIIVTGRTKRAIEDYFDFAPELEYVLKRDKKYNLLSLVRSISNLAHFSFIRQKEPRGDGNAILSAHHLINNDNIAVAYGDEIIFDKKPVFSILQEVFYKFRKPVIALYKIPKKMVGAYGVAQVKKISKNIYKIINIKEKPKINEAPSNLILIGKYIITPDIIECLKKVNNKKKHGEVRLTDAFEEYLKKGGEIYGVEIKGKRFDCGNKLGYLQATVELALNNKETSKGFKKFLKSLKI